MDYETNHINQINIRIMKEILTYLFGHNILTRDEARNALMNIGQGKYSDPEIASFLTVYMMREITPDELSGFREALLNMAVQIDLPHDNTIDVCGTGGDEKNTFNISTLTAFVLAGAGEKVVKHGNYAVSSACGSSNIMEYYGYKFSNKADKLKEELDRCGICYMHAPLFHPAMKHVGPVRKSLRVKTFFNLLGPMINPSRPRNQITGVFNEKVLDLYYKVYSDAGINHYVFYSLDGYDEISLTSNFRAISGNSDKIYSPESIGFTTLNPVDLYGGNSIEEAASIFMNVLNGNGTKAQNSVVQVNSAFALKCLYPEKSLEECIALSKESLEKGKAKEAFSKLIELQ